MKSNMNEIWNLIDALSIDEKKIIYKRMQREINFAINEILDRVDERRENSQITINEITAEVEIVRSENYGQK